MAKPLSQLTCTDQPFNWSEDCEITLEELKHLLLEAPILWHFNPNLPTRIETNASDGVTVGVLSQRASDGDKWHPVAFYLEMMHGAKLNYPVHNKELMAVVQGLKT